MSGGPVRLLHACGARTNFMKVAPVVAAVEASSAARGVPLRVKYSSDTDATPVEFDDGRGDVDGPLRSWTAFPTRCADLSTSLGAGQAMQVMALDGHVAAVPVLPLSEAFGMFPGIDATLERDDEDRVCSSSTPAAGSSDSPGRLTVSSTGPP